MEVGTSIHVEPLHERTDLMNACVDLLNAQWPRSKSARLHSLVKSCDGLPYSLVMVDNKDTSNAVIGYCRLAKVISVPSSVLIESVVVPKKLRGRGLGRRVMELAESHAKMKGFTMMYLSTKDKQDFYAHLGYEFCEAVNTQNAQMLETCDCSPVESNSPSPKQIACSTNSDCSPSECQPTTCGLSVSQPPCSCPELEDRSSDDACPTLQSSTDGSETDLNVLAPPPPPPPPPAPPPPPPPPPPIQVSKTPITVIYWMKKEVA